MSEVRIEGVASLHTRVLLGGALMALGLSAGRPAASLGQTAIPQQPVFTSYRSADGLSHPAVHALLQDRRGFLWIGTQDGLNRFDGTRFVAFRHRFDDSLSLGGDYIRALAESGDGRLWVGTERGGLNLFDPATGQAERFELFDLGPWKTDARGVADDDREGRTVHGIHVLPDGLLLASDLGLIRFDPGSGAAVLLTGETGAAETSVTDMCALPAGAAIGFSDGRIALARAAGRPESLFQLDAGIAALRCRGAEAYAATRDGGIHRIDLENGGRERILTARSSSDATLLIRDLVHGEDGRLWIATDAGLYLAESGGSSVRRVDNESDSSLPDAQVITFLVDATGILWVGTWNGLASLHPLASRMRRIPNRTQLSAGLAGSGVIAIEPGRNREFWLGTLRGGVYRLSTAAGGEPALRRSAALSGLDEGIIYDFATDALGQLWIAAFADGVVRLDPSERRATSIAIVRELDGPAVLVRSIFVDGRGDVWAGTDPLGLLKYDSEAEHFAAFQGPAGDWDFGSRFVWPIVEDDHGVLWVGAFNGGLSSIDPDRQRQDVYTAGPGALSDGRILTIFPDSRGLIWIGTEGGGVHRLDPETRVIQAFTTDEGLPHDNVQAILEDDSGQLWISTNYGLARFDPVAEEFRIYTEAAGLAGNRFFANSAFQSANGELFFGGDRGLTILDPADLEVPNAPPPIALTRFRVHGREAPLARALQPGRLELEPDENFFAFEFAALDFRDPSQNRYRYRLEPLDEDWVDAGGNGVANYTSVPAGRYTFRVEARNSDGVWNRGSFAIPLRVQAPYYQTWWFRSVVALAVLTLISAFYAYRLSELKRRQALRLGIAGQLHDDIGANLSTIALKADMLGETSGADASREGQLAEVGRLAREAAHKVRETVWVVNTQYDTLAGLFSKMRDTADTMLHGQLAHRFDAPKEPPDREIDWELRQDVYFIYKEALHNILKHSEATAVEIALDYRHPELRLRVKDDGKGIADGGQVDGSGLGLMCNRAAKHSGRLEVSGEPGAGTTVSLRVRVR